VIEFAGTTPWHNGCFILSQSPWQNQYSNMKGQSMDKQKASIALFAVLTLATSALIPDKIEAAPPKGGKAGAHMSDKGRANTNAQWSADPEKGWVRAEERRELQDERPDKRAQKRTKLKGNEANKKHSF
jgi:hypothetical protein